MKIISIKTNQKLDEFTFQGQKVIPSGPYIFKFRDDDSVEKVYYEVPCYAICGFASGVYVIWVPQCNLEDGVTLNEEILLAKEKISGQFVSWGKDHYLN